LAVPKTFAFYFFTGFSFSALPHPTLLLHVDFFTREMKNVQQKGALEENNVNQ